MNEDATAGITEDDIANYLANTPGFFERHAELLASVQLASPHGSRAVSLQERQMEMLRERIKGLERKTSRCRSGRWKCCASASRAWSARSWR
jgi:uncharacterized protein YigA (DUF484 family)